MTRASTDPAFVRGRLDDLGRRRKSLEKSLAEMDMQIAGIEREAVSEAVVRKALSELAERFEELPPYQQREMVQLVLSHAEISEENLKLEFFGQPAAPPEMASSEHDSTRSEPCGWLLR